MTVCNDSFVPVLGVVLLFLWGSVGFCWFLRASGLFPRFSTWVKRTRLRGRMLAAILFAAVVVHGGSKDRGNEVQIPRIREMGRSGTNLLAGATNEGFRFTAFGHDGDRFEMDVSWPPTNSADYAGIDIFYKRNLDDSSWRWIRREEIGNPETASRTITVFGNDLPYWEQEVPRRFRVYTNEVDSPFGVVFTNIVARVAVATEPSSGFFLVGNQHDSDDDGTPDMVETSLGLDPSDPDTDGDGVPDGRELLAGSDPFAADTDGDGLPDSVELSWGRIATNGLSRWIDLSESTNRIVLFSDADDDAVYVPVPVDFRLFGRTMTNLAVNANGLVGWSAGEPPFRAGWSSNDRPGRIPLSDDPSATAAAFWDDLRVRPSMESCVSFASSGTDGAKTAVVEFSNMGFVSGGSNAFVSFQVQFSEAETNAVLVVFSEASGRGTGSSATVGARSTRDDGIAYAFNEPDSVFPGLAVECHFGFGSDPSKTDTDGDGLPDGDELAAGTDPRLADTDGDGLSDGEEIATGTDPLDDDTDDDLLPDGWEVEQGLDPLDDDDGLSDGDGDGLTFGEEIFVHFTNPACWDSDADGLSDGDELVAGTNLSRWDTDRDGIPDGLEIRLGTNPLSSDTDGDGLKDGWERDHAPFDPGDPSDGAADFDGDGLSNANEINVRKTDWRKADTDGDGLPDGAEFAAGTNPSKTDTDDDGLSDPDEATIGTNPNRADTDGDGCPDGWEVIHGFNPLSSSSPVLSADPDGDGLPNETEARFGTNPFSGDTDGDGLSDRTETGWISRGAATVYDLAGTTNLLAGLSDPDDAMSNVFLPFPVILHNAWFCSNLVFDLDGRINLSTQRDSLAYWSPNESHPLVVEAFCDDLEAFPSELGSELRAGEIVVDGIRRFVIEYRAFGFHGLSVDPTNAVSFQIEFAENATNEVRVSFFRADGGTPRSGTEDPLSDRALGSNARLGAATPRTSLPFSDREPVASPGLGIVYHLGTGSNPLFADSDGDGIPDADEMASGTDPLDSDMDGDGLSDGEEDAAGTDPRSPNDGDDAVEADPDGDGLSNGMESFVGTDWHLADTDGDGVSDGAEWRQGSDPLDPADSAPRDTVETTIRFGDESGSHSEKYEATVTPVSGDTRPPVKLLNREFGEPDELTVHLVSNAVYAVSLRHVTSNRPSPDLDYTLGISATDATAGLAALVLDPDGLTGSYDDVSLSRFAATARVAVVRARLLADKNRDGSIDDADETPGPLRLWINDDRDNGSIAGGDSDVPTGGTGALFNIVSCNCTDDHVNGLSDLEDYFPVWLDVSEALSVLQAACPTSRIALRLSQADAAVGIVNTDLVRSGAGGYLRNPVVSAGYASADDVVVGSAGAEYPSSDFARLLANPDKGVSLIEGLKATCEPLELELRLDGRTALRTRLPLLIVPIEGFYRWINFRGIADGPVSKSTDVSPPPGFPDSESNGKNVVFVHGFNVTEREARGWNAEMFKRLWQSGCNAKYHAVTWYGDVGYPNGMYYHSDANNAFLSAADLATYVSGLSGETTLMAHSLGNMVASSAIQDWFLSVSRYFMLNAAVPAEAYDGSQWNTNSVGNRMLHPDWEEYEPRTWCSAWFTNFHDPDDSRRRLAWRGRFADVFSRTTLYNFHSGTEASVGDQVLEVNANRPDMIDALHYSFPWTIETGHLAWQKQEFGKGRLASINWHVAGTTWAGWGFSGNNVPATTANAMTEAQLRSSPVFRHSPDKMFVSPIPYTDRCEILTYGIPALSGPAGTRVLEFTQNQTINASRNIDMATFKDDSTWPVNTFFGTRWLHSDFKAVALPNVFGLFNEFCTKGNLK